MIIEPGSWTADEVLSELSVRGIATQDLRIEPRASTLQFRAVDAAVLVAVIGAVGSTLTALVAGLLQMSTIRKGQRISIELESGSKIDVPSDVAPDELERIIASLSGVPSRIILP
ncbi:hypothetical protein ACWF9B_28055 [Streptomyces sp. NPDC055089]